MKIKINSGVANGVVNAPPSKSYAHRLLICASLAEGISKIQGISDSKDMKATLNCLASLGVPFKKDSDNVIIEGRTFEASLKTHLDCYESGSTIRFFIPIALAIGGEYELYGTERLLSRGFDVYRDICSEQKIVFENDGRRIFVKGKLSHGTFNVRGDVSSQFISGLLFALPLLDGDSVINITTELESAKYVDMTIDALKTFGIEIAKSGNSFFVKGNQKYLPTSVLVEGDMSNSAFLDAFNFLGGRVLVTGLNNNTLQPDGVYLRLFDKLKEDSPTIDVSSCPDLSPILMALSATKNGATFTGTRRLKIKESDRALAMAEELGKLGINVNVYENSVVVHKGNIKAPNESLSGHNDHRIVMALSVICSLCGGIIDGCEAVGKSYPNFFDEISKLGIVCEVIE